MKRIFISHSSKDAEIAKEVCDVLEENNNRCWIAPRDISYGEQWAKEIANGLIEETKLFVFLLSKNSNKSNQVIKEINLAVNFNLPILVIKIGDVKLNRALMYYLSDIHIYTCAGENAGEEVAKIILEKESVSIIKRDERVGKANISTQLGNTMAKLFNDDGKRNSVETNTIRKQLNDLMWQNYLNLTCENEEYDYLNSFDDELEAELGDDNLNNDGRRYTGDWLDPQHGFSGEIGKYFSVTDSEETEKLVYIVQKHYDAVKKEMWFETKYVFYDEQRGKEGKIRTFFVDEFSSEGNLLVILTLFRDKECCSMSYGFLTHDDVRISKDATFMDVRKDMNRNEEAVRKFIADTDCDIITIDSELWEPAEIQREYNYSNDRYENYMYLKPGKTYIAFEILRRSKDGNDVKKKIPVSDYEIGYNYYIGQSGLEQNWLKAAEHLIMSDDERASYYLGCIFMKDKLLKNNDMAKEYLMKAAEGGIEMADVLLDELKKDSSIEN